MYLEFGNKFLSCNKTEKTQRDSTAINHQVRKTSTRQTFATRCLRLQWERVSVHHSSIWAASLIYSFLHWVPDQFGGYFIRQKFEKTNHPGGSNRSWDSPAPCLVQIISVRTFGSPDWDRRAYSNSPSRSPLLKNGRLPGFSSCRRRLTGVCAGYLSKIKSISCPLISCWLIRTWSEAAVCKSSHTHFDNNKINI